MVAPHVIVDELLQASQFSGVVRVDRRGETLHAVARGLANRAHGVPNTVDTRFAIASGTKTITALTVVSLVAEGVLTMDTTARSMLGDDLPLIDDAVTVEHLLAHRSGIGDYFHEDASGSILDHVLAIPVHRLDSVEAHLQVLDGFPQRDPPGTRFAYNNSGYVVLALIAERACGRPFAELVDERVCRRAGMRAAGFVRSDAPAGDVAVGYLDVDGLRTNVLHMPRLGGGDGGMFATVDDVHQLWRAVLAGAVVPAAWVERMVQPHSPDAARAHAYGLGFWLGIDPPTIQMEGYDAGVSFRSTHDPRRDLTWTVVSNTTEGAWPVARALAEQFAADALDR